MLAGCTAKRVIDLFKALGVGSSFSIIAALVLSFVMLIPIIVIIVIVGGEESDSTVWAAVLVAPIAEELTKGVGVMFFRKRFTGLESGLIYGASSGWASPRWRTCSMGSISSRARAWNPP